MIQAARLKYYLSIRTQFNPLSEDNRKCSWPTTLISLKKDNQILWFQFSISFLMHAIKQWKHYVMTSVVLDLRS